MTRVSRVAAKERVVDEEDGAHRVRGRGMGAWLCRGRSWIDGRVQAIRRLEPIRLPVGLLDPPTMSYSRLGRHL